jgi:hypothetical protein
MLEQFVPDVLRNLREQLTSGTQAERWAATKEIMPFLWGKKSTVQVGPQDKEKESSLVEYLSAQPPVDPVPAPPSESDSDIAA